MSEALNLFSLETQRSEAAQRRHPVDMVHLAKQTLGDSGLEAEILLMFSEIVKGYMGKLKKGGTEGEIIHHLHTIKGAAMGVGASSIAVLAKATEAEFRETRILREESVDDLAMAVEEASVFIAGLISDYTASAEA